jgi:hypothetical protein
MTRMQVQNNYFSGTIPSEFGLLSKLDFITIDGNELTGTIPPEMCALRGEEAGVLRQFVVDCYNGRTTKGFDCQIPECCTLCRNSREKEG